MMKLSIPNDIGARDFVTSVVRKGYPIGVQERHRRGFGIVRGLAVHPQTHSI